MSEPEDNMAFLVCDTCGSVVEGESLELHSSWHDTLCTLRSGPVANPNRTRITE